MRKIIVSLTVLLAAGASFAGEFSGNLIAGYGFLQRPDVGPSISKGGINAFAQGFWEEGKLAYGGETGVMEIYGDWGASGPLPTQQSLALIPLNALVKYYFSPEGLRPFVFGGAGGYFPIEGGSSDPAGVSTSRISSSKVFPGITAGLGLQWKVSSRFDGLFSVRFFGVNAPDPISVITLSVGLVTRQSFIPSNKAKALKDFSEKEKATEDKQ